MSEGLEEKLSGLSDEKNNQALNALAGLGGLAPELQEVVKTKFSTESTEQTENVEATETTGENTEEQTGSIENQEASSEQSNSDFEIEIENPIFGGKTKIVKKKEENEVSEIKDLESLSTLVKDYGIEDITTLPVKIKEWRDNEKTLGEVSERLANAEKLFSTLPPELYQAVETFTKGGNWKESLTSNSVNFDKNLEDYKPEELVEGFFPGKFSQEDWEEFNDEDGDPKVKKAIEFAIEQANDKFKTTKESKIKLSEQAILDAKKQEQVFLSSVSESAKKLSSQIEGVDAMYIKTIEKDLGNPRGIYNLFYNEDGTLKESAALSYAMAKDGYSLMDQYKKVIERMTETKVNQDLLLRGASTPSGSKGSNSHKEEVRPEVQKEIERIRRLGVR